jgi:hypothetical protein
MKVRIFPRILCETPEVSPLAESAFSTSSIHKIQGVIASTVAVVGASGSGKSSLVFAGLIPQLREDTVNNWLILSFRPGKNPFQALAVALVSALNLPDNERRLAELELDVNLQGDSATLQNFFSPDGKTLASALARRKSFALQYGLN